MIRILVSAFRRLLKKARDRYNVDNKTGLLGKEIERLLKYPDFNRGQVELFGNEFEFSHSKAFLHSVDEIFKNDIYLFETTKHSPVILDCGANIGLSVLYFYRLFPNAIIHAFEPDPEIFSILERNMKEYCSNSNVFLYQKAVWKEQTTLDFYSEGGLGGSNVLDSLNKKQLIQVETIDLKNFLTKQIDFLKIDIEGAENTVFFDIVDCLDRVENIFLEYHGILNQKQNLGDILNILTKKGFEYYIRVAGETMKFPYFEKMPKIFNQQLNIFCYRKNI